MKRIFLSLLLLFILFTPVSTRADDKDIVYIENESVNWRIGIAITTASLIKDDVLRSYFTDRAYIIEKYSSAPKNWANPSDHRNITEAFIWNYEEFIKYLKKSDWDTAVKYYSVMAHYLGDAADPYSVEPSNETIQKIYETYLELVSGDVFSYIFATKTTLDLKKIDEIEETISDLIKTTKSYKQQCDTAIKENDTATLDYIINTLAKKSVTTLYGILLKAFDESGIGKISRVIYRYSMILFTASVAAIILVAVREVIKKKKKKETILEEEL